MSKRSDNLVRELASLFSKYSASEIRTAVDDLSSGRSFADFDRLASLTVGLTKKVTPAAGAKSRKPKASAKDLLERDIDEMKKSGEPGSLDVARVLEGGRDGKILRTSTAIMQLLAPLGVEVSRGGDRLSLLRTLGVQLLALDTQRRETLLQAAQETTGNSSSLERWTNIIVRGERSS